MPHLILSIIAALIWPAAALAGLSQNQITHDGLARSYRLYAPDRATTQPMPLVIVLHGGGGTGREVIYSTRGRFNELAERDGFLVVYPDAIGRMWDTGGGQMSRDLDPRRDDDGFLLAVISELSRDHKVDRGRIFVTGISRGGMMSYALGCAHPDVVRAIAPVAMPLPEASVRECTKGPGLGLLLIHGTADPYVPYDGGAINLGRRDRDRVVSAPKTYTAFLRLNGCGGDSISATGSVDVHRATGCSQPTGFASVGGGGHNWPGGRKTLPGGRAGPINTDISAPDLIWEFFRQF